MKKYALILALAICVGVGGWFVLHQDTPPVEETTTETINEETPEITADPVDTEETTETETETPVEETPVVEDADNNDAGFDVSKYESVFQEIFDGCQLPGLTIETALNAELGDIDTYKQLGKLPHTCTHDDYIQWRNEMLGGSQSSNTPSQPSNNESKPSSNTSSSKPSNTTPSNNQSSNNTSSKPSNNTSSSNSSSTSDEDLPDWYKDLVGEGEGEKGANNFDSPEDYEDIYSPDRNYTSGVNIS